MNVLGPSGTLVMPAPSSDLTDPASWSAPPMPEAWRADIRATMPSYDPRTTPTWGMGIVAEQFRVTAAVNRARIAVVHELLQRTRLRMEQLAERAGFGSARHMRRVWQQYHPSSPTRVRETFPSETA